MIKNVNYSDRGVFDEEMELIHNAGWVFLCLLDSVSENNAYVTYEIGAKRLVLQNFEGKINCFENICQHRFNKIQQGYNGNSPFFCKYHSWGYNSEGEAIVGEQFVQQLEAENRKCLKRYDVEICGKFVFAKVNPEFEGSLKSYLGEFWDVLTEVSENIDSVINKDYIVIPHKANWKLLVENVLECYHCSSVHKETLVPIGIGSKRPENHLADDFHDMIDYPIRIGRQQKERNAKLNFLDKKSYIHNSLRHIYIYPNLFITSTDGTLFYIGRLTPENEADTALLVNFARPVLKDLTKKEEFIANAFFESSPESAQKVIFEDREILENIQSNLPLIKDLTQIFGDEEFRIVRFHEKISNFVKYF